MGTYPSLYYGADFEPHAIIVAKPLTNIGTIENRARLLAPEVFPTGIDVLHMQTGGLENAEVQELDNRFGTSLSRQILAIQPLAFLI